MRFTLPGQTIFESIFLYKIIGFGSLSIFIAGVIFAVVIYLRRLDFRYQFALLPLALLPLVFGIFGLSSAMMDVLVGLSQNTSELEIKNILLSFSEIIPVFSASVFESVILLFICHFVILVSPRKQSILNSL